MQSAELVELRAPAQPRALSEPAGEYSPAWITSLLRRTGAGADGVGALEHDGLRATLRVSARPITFNHAGTDHQSIDSIRAAILAPQKQTARDPAAAYLICLDRWWAAGFPNPTPQCECDALP